MDSVDVQIYWPDKTVSVQHFELLHAADDGTSLVVRGEFFQEHVKKLMRGRYRNESVDPYSIIISGLRTIERNFKVEKFYELHRDGCVVEMALRAA